MSAQVRLWGDPFCENESSRALRSFLMETHGRGWRVSLSLTGAVGERPGVGRSLPLNDGARDFAAHTRLSDEQLAPIFRAGQESVAATAPLVVFAGEDLVVTAGLEYPEACLLWSGTVDAPGVLLDQLELALEDLGLEHLRPALGAVEMEQLVQLAPADPRAPILHPCWDPLVDGTDVLLRVRRLGSSTPRPLVILLPRRDSAVERELLDLAGGDEPVSGISFAAGPLSAGCLGGVSAVVWPLRALNDPENLLRVMASCRPLVVSRNHHTASILSGPGLCVPVGGSHVSREGQPHFEPDGAMLADGLRGVCEEWRQFTATAARARDHVLTHHTTPRPPRPAVPRRNSRPFVVLEAPLFEISSAAMLTIETARTLQRRDRVDLRLVPRLPFRNDVGHLRRCAPSLVPLLSRNPGRPDLWLSAGWPPRANRPDARCFALRFDWEYGALPMELSPLVPQEADLLLVHSRAVQRVVVESGREESSIARIPPGVDGRVFHEDAVPCPEVLRFKGQRPAVLFVGGLIWRKGIDLFLKAVAEVGKPADICVVVKSIGTSSSYYGQNMARLVQRFATTPGAPEMMIVDREMEPAGLAGLYRACDLMLHPYRGEGYGIPVLEAQACGLPVMVSAGGSTDDFCDPRGSVTIPTRKHFPKMSGVYQFPPHVLEPDYPELLSRMRRTLRRLPELQCTARAAASELRANHTWDRAAEALEGIAFGIAARPADSSVGSRSCQGSMAGAS